MITTYIFSVCVRERKRERVYVLESLLFHVWTLNQLDLLDIYLQIGFFIIFLIIWNSLTKFIEGVTSRWSLCTYLYYNLKVHLYGIRRAGSPINYVF